MSGPELNARPLRWKGARPLWRVSLGRRLVTVFPREETARGFISYCDALQIRSRADWNRKACDRAKLRYAHTTCAGDRRALSPFTPPKKGRKK